MEIMVDTYFGRTPSLRCPNLKTVIFLEIILRRIKR